MSTSNLSQLQKLDFKYAITWREFKTRAESAGIRDNDLLVYVDFHSLHTVKVIDTNGMKAIMCDEYLPTEEELRASSPTD